MLCDENSDDTPTTTQSSINLQLTFNLPASRVSVVSTCWPFGGLSDVSGRGCLPLSRGLMPRRLCRLNEVGSSVHQLRRPFFVAARLLGCQPLLVR